MMTPFAWLALSLALYLAGALLSLCLARNDNWAIKLSGTSSLLAGLAGVAAALPVLTSTEPLLASFDGPFVAFARLTLRLDALAAFMVLVISLLATITALYSLAYLQEYRGRAGAMGFHMNLFIASMVALVVTDNAFYFIILFEVMSLSSYFLVISDQDDEAINAGLLYFLIAHAG